MRAQHPIGARQWRLIQSRTEQNARHNANLREIQGGRPFHGPLPYTALEWEGVVPRIAISRCDCVVSCCRRRSLSYTVGMDFLPRGVSCRRPSLSRAVFIRIQPRIQHRPQRLYSCV